MGFYAVRVPNPNIYALLSFYLFLTASFGRLLPCGRRLCCGFGVFLALSQFLRLSQEIISMPGSVTSWIFGEIIRAVTTKLSFSSIHRRGPARGIFSSIP